MSLSASYGSGSFTAALMRYSSAQCLGCESHTVTGNPDHLRRETKPHDAHVHAAVHPADESTQRKALLVAAGEQEDLRPFFAPRERGQALGFSAIPMSQNGHVLGHDYEFALNFSSGSADLIVVICISYWQFYTHELAHEMLHHGKAASPLPKVIRETQAEAVAFVVSSAVGLETNKAASDYIALYNGDKKTLAESLAVIQETAAKILEDLLPRERPGPSLSPASQSATPRPSETRAEPSAAPDPLDASRSAADSQILGTWDR
jgi:hypothetical protein